MKRPASLLSVWITSCPRLSRTKTRACRGRSGQAVAAASETGQPSSTTVRPSTPDAVGDRVAPGDESAAEPQPTVTIAQIARVAINRCAMVIWTRHRDPTFRFGR